MVRPSLSGTRRGGPVSYAAVNVARNDWPATWGIPDLVWKGRPCGSSRLWVTAAPANGLYRRRRAWRAAYLARRGSQQIRKPSESPSGFT